MNDLPFHKTLRKLIEASIRNEQSYIRLVEKYTDFLLLFGRNPTLVSFTLARLLHSLMMIQHIQWVKIRQYHELSPRYFKGCITNFCAEELHQIVRQNEVLIERIQDLLSERKTMNLPSLRWYLEELSQHCTKKKQFFSYLYSSPAKPWISPHIRSFAGKQAP